MKTNNLKKIEKTNWINCIVDLVKKNFNRTLNQLIMKEQTIKNLPNGKAL